MRRRTLLLTIIGTLTIAGIAIGLSREREDEVLTKLGPYATAEKTIIVDVAGYYKSIGGSSMPLSSKDLQPILVHSLKLENVAFKDISTIIKRTLTKKEGWEISNPGSSSHYMLQAHYGSDHIRPGRMVMIYPDYSSSKKEHPADPMCYLAISFEQLSPWQLSWLKVKRLGRGQYETTTNFSSAFTFE